VPERIRRSRALRHASLPGEQQPGVSAAARPTRAPRQRPRPLSPAEAKQSRDPSGPPDCGDLRSLLDSANDSCFRGHAGVCRPEGRSGCTRPVPAASGDRPPLHGRQDAGTLSRAPWNFGDGGPWLMVIHRKWWRAPCCGVW
jgi:hypothetical protein